MIRRLRARHDVYFVGLLLTVPFIATLALLLRPPAGISIGGFPLDPRAHDEVRGVVWSQLELSHTLAAGDPPRIALWATEPLGVPDPLLYWAAQPPTGDELPAGARLIGALDRAHRGLALRLDEASTRPGALVVYSLGHRRVVAHELWDGVPQPN